MTYPKKILATTLATLILIQEGILGIPSLYERADAIATVAPVNVTEYSQTSWAGGTSATTPVSGTGSPINFYSTADVASNLDTSGGSLKLKAGSTNTDPNVDNPSYNANIEAQFEGVNNDTSIPGNPFDGNTNTFVWLAGAPWRRMVSWWGEPGNACGDGRDTTTSWRNNPFYNRVELQEAQPTCVKEPLYYRAKITLKRSYSVNQIKLMFDNRLTRYEIRASNDDITYTPICTMADDPSPAASVTSWTTCAFSATTYKYFKFYFNGVISGDFTQNNADGSTLTGWKDPYVILREFQILASGNDSGVPANTIVTQNGGFGTSGNYPPNAMPRRDFNVSHDGNWNYNGPINGKYGTEIHWGLNFGADTNINSFATVDLGAQKLLNGINIYLYNRDDRKFWWYKVVVCNTLDGSNNCVADANSYTWDRTGANADPNGYEGKQALKLPAPWLYRYYQVYRWKGIYITVARGGTGVLTRWENSYGNGGGLYGSSNWWGLGAMEATTPYHYAAVESPIIDFGTPQEFIRTTLAGTYDTFGKEARLYIRTGDTQAFNQNTWSRYAEVMGQVPKYLQNHRYFQYKILLLARDPNTTPVITGFSVTHKAYRQDWPTVYGDFSGERYVPLASNITRPSESWKFNLGGLMQKRYTRITDVDGDGVVDIIMLQWGRLIAKRWYKVDPNNPTPYTDDTIWDTVNRGWTDIMGIYDFKGDGKKEILVSRADNPRIDLVDLSTGNIVWGSNFGHSWNSIGSDWGAQQLKISDLDNDGGMEIFYTTMNQVDDRLLDTGVFKFSSTVAGVGGWKANTPRGDYASGAGNLLWRANYAVSNITDQSNNSAIANVTGDAKKEIMVPGAYYWSVDGRGRSGGCCDNHGLEYDEWLMNVLDGMTGQKLFSFNAPQTQYVAISPNNFVLIWNQSINGAPTYGSKSFLFDGDQGTYYYSYDANIYDSGSIDWTTNISSNFQKNGMVVDFGTPRTFDRIDFQPYVDASGWADSNCNGAGSNANANDTYGAGTRYGYGRNKNYIIEGTNSYDPVTKQATWTRLYEVNPTHNDNLQFCGQQVANLVTPTVAWAYGIGSAQSFRYVRFSGTGNGQMNAMHWWTISGRGMVFAEARFRLGGNDIDVSGSVYGTTSVYVYNGRSWWNALPMMTRCYADYEDFNNDGYAEGLYTCKYHSSVNINGLFHFGGSGGKGNAHWIWAKSAVPSEIPERHSHWNQYIEGEVLAPIDYDGDGKKEFLYQNVRNEIVCPNNNDMTCYQTAHLVDVLTGNPKMVKMKAMHQGDSDNLAADAIVSMITSSGLQDHWTSTSRCPNDGNRYYTETEKNNMVCELFSMEFDTGTLPTIDRVDMAPIMDWGGSYAAYRIDGITATGTTWEVLVDHSNGSYGNGGISTAIPALQYKAIRFNLSRPNNAGTAVVPGGFLRWVKLYRSGSDITPTLINSMYLYRSDGVVLGANQSNTYWSPGFYSKVGPSGTYDKAVWVYTDMRSQIYGVNKAKSLSASNTDNSIYFDYLYSANARNDNGNNMGRQHTSVHISTINSNELGSRENHGDTYWNTWMTMTGMDMNADGVNDVPVHTPVGDTFKYIDGQNGTDISGARFPITDAGSVPADILYVGDAGGDIGPIIIIAKGNGKIEIDSLTSKTTLKEIVGAYLREGTYNRKNMFEPTPPPIIADMDNDGSMEVAVYDGFGTQRVFDVSNASPINPPVSVWNGGGWTVGAAMNFKENLVGQSAVDQGKNIWMRGNNGNLGRNSDKSFTWDKQPMWNPWRFHFGLEPMGDKVDRNYKTIAGEYWCEGWNWADPTRGMTEYRDVPSKVAYESHCSNNVAKQVLGGAGGDMNFWNKSQTDQNVLWATVNRDMQYSHSPQGSSWDVDNDGYDDIVMNNTYGNTYVLSGRDGHIIRYLSDWDQGAEPYPAFAQLDSDPQIESFNQTNWTTMVVNKLQYGYGQTARRMWAGSTDMHHWTHWFNGQFGEGIVDVDGNGIWDIFTNISDGNIKIWTPDADTFIGSASGFWLKDGEAYASDPSDGGMATSITAIDIDGDGKQNLVVSQEDGYIYAINPQVDFTNPANLVGQGQNKFILWTYRIGSSVGPISFADVLNRGKTDMVVEGADGYIRVITQASVTKPTAVRDGSTQGINMEFTQTTNQIGANWNAVSGALGYIVKFVSDTGQEIVPDTIVTNTGGSTTVPTSALIPGIGLQTGKRYFAMVKAYDAGGTSEYVLSDGLEVVGFTITKQVRNASDPSSQFQDSITVGPGEMVQYRITITNRTNREAGGGKYDVFFPNSPLEVSTCTGPWAPAKCEDRAVVVEDYMPKGFTYIAGTTVVNGLTRPTETAPYFVFDGTTTQTNLPTSAGSVLRWKFPKTDTIDPFGGTMEVLFTAQVQ